MKKLALLIPFIISSCALFGPTYTGETTASSLLKSDTSDKPLKNPKDAKYVPVKISAIDTAAPNQIRPFSNTDVRLFILTLLCILSVYIK